MHWLKYTQRFDVFLPRSGLVQLLTNRNYVAGCLKSSRILRRLVKNFWRSRNLFRFSWPLSPTALVQPVAVCDIAEVAARALDSVPKNRFFNVLGPESLTLPEMTEILGRALGRPIEYIELSDEDFVARFGPFVGAPLAQALAVIYRLWEREGAVGDTAPLQREFGISLTSCEDYARGLAKAWKSEGLI